MVQILLYALQRGTSLVEKWHLMITHLTTI
jgi:hypothetical protein